MEENVALDSAKQKQFVKSVRGIKKLLKKKGKVPKKAVVTPKKDGVQKDSIIKKRKKRGLVYLSHIPHGFYEHEMTEYFKQFGVVTNARVIRSRRTGNSKGYAFVEFKEPTVAEIVADTMNNYLMGKRLIKAVYVPPSKQRRNVVRKNWNYQNNPITQLRLKLKKQHNADKSDTEELNLARKMLSNLNKTKKKLTEVGIDYDFFKPVDVPMELTEEIEKKSSTTVVNVDVKSEEEMKVESSTQLKGSKKEVKSEPEVKSKKEKKGKQNNKTKPGVEKKVQAIEKDGQVPSVKKNKVEGTKQQKEKQAKLVKAGVKALEDFIKVKEDSNGESDSSVDFDSDEYEKMIENDNDTWSEEESDLKIVEGKGKAKQNNKKINKTPKISSPKQDKLQNKPEKLQNKKINNKSVQHPKKRKLNAEPTTSPKNAKFEKQNKKKPLNKLIKKK